MDHLSVHVSDMYIGTLTLFVFPASLDSSHLIWEEFIGLCDIFSLAFTLQLSFTLLMFVIALDTFQFYYTPPKCIYFSYTSVKLRLMVKHF